MEQFSLISSAMKEILELRDMVRDPPEGASYQQYPGAQIRRNQGLARIQTLTNDIAQMVVLDGAAIYPMGPMENQDKFSELAEDEGDALIVRSDEVYEEIAKAIEPHLGTNKTWRWRMTFPLHNVLIRLAQGCGMDSIQVPNISQFFDTPSIDLVSEVKSIVRKSNGDDLNIAYIHNKIFHEIMGLHYDANVIAVVVVGATPEEVEGGLGQGLFGGKKVVVDVSKIPDVNEITIVSKKLKPMYSRVTEVKKNSKIKNQE
jgi:hypothetical protein